MLWQTELHPHAAGEFSMATALANLVMEDQAQVLASPAATLVSVYDGHGRPQAPHLPVPPLQPLPARPTYVYYSDFLCLLPNFSRCLC
jgi:hypothetical protein